MPIRTSLLAFVQPASLRISMAHARRRSWWGALPGVAAATLLTGRLTAQQPAMAETFARLDSALATGTQPSVDPALRGSARELALAYQDVASWTRTQHRATMEKALFRIATVNARQRRWAWPHLLAARAFLLLRMRDAPVLESAGSRPGEDHLQTTWRHLEAAVQLDADFLEARRLIAELGFRSGERDLREPARSLLADEARRLDALPHALISWARHLRREGDLPGALSMVERAGVRGGDRSVLELERARTLAAVRQDSAAVAAYWRGLEDITTESGLAYRQDFGWLVIGDSLRSMQAVADSGLREWARRFWGARDAATVRPEGSRVLEHLQRWLYVHAMYRVPQPWTRRMYTRVDIGFDAPPVCVGSVTPFFERLPIKPPTWPGDARFDEPLLDHRAMLYLRHGRPYEQLAVPFADDPTATPLDSAIVPDRFGQAMREQSISRSGLWVYWIEGRWRVYSLRGSNALGSHAPTTLASFLSGGLAAWEALANLDSTYAKVAADIRRVAGRMTMDGPAPPVPPSCEKAFQDAVRQMRVDANVGIDTDSDTPRFARPWRAILRFFGHGSGADGSGRALVSFAVPTDDLRNEIAPDGRMLWKVHMAVSAYRAHDGMRVDLDTTRQFVTTTIPRGGVLSGWVELPLGTGTWQVATMLRQPGDSSGGAWAMRRNLDIADGPALSMSDLVLGRAGGTGWRAPDGAFPLNTLGAWPIGGEVEVWYEVRGMVPGEEYRTTIEVVPTTNRRAQPVRVSTIEVPSESLIRVRRNIGLEQLAPGRYTLTITVERAGVRASRQQEILVLR